MGQALFIAANKQRAGNALSGRAVGAGRSGPVFWGCGGAVWGRNFGGSRLGLASLALNGELIGLAAAMLRNGGFLRFLTGRPSGVGTIVSERFYQVLDIARLFSVEQKPVRLHQLAAVTTDGPQGVPPPSARALLLFPGRAWQGQNLKTNSAQARPITPCLRDQGSKIGIEGREIPLAPLGSGVRAAHSAGLSGRFWRRPKFLEKRGLGKGLVRSSAQGLSVSDQDRLGRG
jgi:hypothetical protein